MKKLLLLLLTFATLSQAFTITEAIEKVFGLTDAYVWEKKRQILPYPDDPFRALYGYFLSGDLSLAQAILYDYVYYRHLYRGCFQGSEDSRRWLKLHIGKCKNSEIIGFKEPRGKKKLLLPGISTSHINKPEYRNLSLYLSSTIAVITSSVVPNFPYYVDATSGVSQSRLLSTRQEFLGRVGFGFMFKDHPSLKTEWLTIIINIPIDTQKVRTFLEKEDLFITPEPVLFTLIIGVSNIKDFDHSLRIPQVQVKTSGAGAEVSQEDLLKWFAVYRRLSQGLDIKEAYIFEILEQRPLFESEISWLNYTDPIYNLLYSLGRIQNPVVLFHFIGHVDIFTVEDAKALIETLKKDPAFVEKMSEDILHKRVPFKFYTLTKIFLSQ